MRLDDTDRLTDLEILVSDLARRVAELEAAQTVPQAVARAATGPPALEEPQAIPERLTRAARGIPVRQEQRGRSGRVRCPACLAVVWPSQLEAHNIRFHPPAPAPTAELPDAEIRRRLGVPEEWRCASCGFYTRAQSLKNPDYCTSCARAQPIGVLREIAA